MEEEHLAEAFIGKEFHAKARSRQGRKGKMI
jgi:hypothetical protein